MQAYVFPIQCAIFLFPILAAILTLPYALHQYRTYGSMMKQRIVLVYSFVFYLLCAYFLVILPLPPISEVANYTNATTQLQPFLFIKELIQVYQATNSISATLENSLFLTIAFNVLLSFPLGMYLRYYFNFSFRKTLFCTFLVSLSFELLQLSALFGIYPRPYRLFDVDDLIINTLGGILGYACAPLCSFFLPSRHQLDEIAYHKGTLVSNGRRCMALFFDVLITLGLSTGIYYLLSQQMEFQFSIDLLYAWICAVTLMELIVPLFFHGQTIGKRIVKITLVQVDEKPIRWFQSIYHYGFLYLGFLPLPLYAYFYVSEVFQQSSALLVKESIFLFLIVMIYFLLLLQSVGSLISTACFPLYSLPWHLHNASTLSLPSEKDMQKEEDSNPTTEPAENSPEENQSNEVENF